MRIHISQLQERVVVFYPDLNCTDYSIVRVLNKPYLH